MSEPKPMASLSSTLLARKGQAKPAMRPQGFANFGFGVAGAHDDLGWNDMGHDVPGEHVKREHGLGAAAEPASPGAEIVSIAKVQAELPAAAVQPVVVTPAVVRQQEDLARGMVAAPVARIPRAAAGSKAKAAFTLRLDPDRHLRLRLACAVTHKSAQMVVTDALDAFLEALPGVAELARTAGKAR